MSSKKIRFDILTIFPKIFDSYFNESILKRAREKKLVEIRTHNIRGFSRDKHHKTDDKPFGGGAGMVMMAEPILRTAEWVMRRGKRKEKTKIAVLSAKGKFFNQKMAYDWAKKYDRIILISGRYEGIDERVTKILHARSTYSGQAEEISIGPYVLTDGDVAAMAIVSAVTRLIPGVIKPESLEEESHWNLLLRKGAVRETGGLEYSQYTRPEVLVWKKKKYRVPAVLLSGNHKKIAAWRRKQASL